jgi:O-acetyl-ADP-ribose deacetylase (regulator of RNase III)
MSAGIALEFKIRFKKVGKLLNQHKGVGQVAVIKQSPNSEHYVLYLVTKENFYDKPTYSDLQLALEQARDLCHELKIKELAMPKIGCGLDGLDWNRVRKIIQSVFTPSNTKIIVFQLADPELPRLERFPRKARKVQNK